MNPWIAYILGLMTPAFLGGIWAAYAWLHDWALDNVQRTWLDRGKWFFWIRFWKPAIVIKLPGAKWYVKFGWRDFRSFQIQLGQKDKNAR